jgi:hypothetical protein
LSVLLPPRSNCCFMRWSIMLLMNALCAPTWTWSSCAGKALWVNCLTAVANSCRYSPLCWVLVVSWLQYTAARSWSLNSSSDAPVSSLHVAPLGLHVDISQALQFGKHVDGFYAVSDFSWLAPIS